MCPCPHCLRPDTVSYGTYATRSGRRRRFRCRLCKRTFSTNTGAPHHRIQHPLWLFERVLELTHLGWSRANIAHSTGISWNTVSRWQRHVKAGDDGQEVARRLDR